MSTILRHERFFDTRRSLLQASNILPWRVTESPTANGQRKETGYSQFLHYLEVADMIKF
jgi:hypothetical protein